MAKSSAKQQLRDNQKRLKLLKQILTISNVSFVFGRLLVFRGSSSWSLYAAALAMTAAQLLCFTAVNRMAEPLLGQDGEILDGGVDISGTSIASYYQDVIYLCAFVQVACIFTDRAFWAFWLLPLVAGFIVYTTLVKPLMSHASAPKDVPETDAERKRREKAEKKAQRPKMVKAHR